MVTEKKRPTRRSKPKSTGVIIILMNVSDTNDGRIDFFLVQQFLDLVREGELDKITAYQGDMLIRQIQPRREEHSGQEPRSKSNILLYGDRK